MDGQAGNVLKAIRERQAHGSQPGGFTVRENRRTVRRLCRWPAIAHTKPYNRRAVVEDISTDGCRIRINTYGMVANQKIVVEIPSQSMILDGKIQWIRNGEAGVLFDYGEESRLIRPDPA